MRFRKNRHDGSFFALLTRQAELLLSGAETLADLIDASAEDRPGFAKDLHHVENEADTVTHEISQKLNQTFVTPLDRDDISTIASLLDDCMDNMDEAGDLISLYKLAELPDRICDQIDVIHRCAELTAEAMPRLVSPADLRSYWLEINRLENQGDRAYRKLLAELFESGRDPKEIIKLKDVIEALEAATDCFEHLANAIETVAIKES